MNAQMLDCAINDAESSDRVMDMLQEMIGKGVCAEVDTVNHIFSSDHPQVPEVLPRFIVDRCIGAAQPGALQNLQLEKAPHSFLGIMLQTTLSGVSSSQPPPQESECNYHMHQTPEACYKKHSYSADDKRQQSLKLERDRTRKDSEEVVKEAEANGVKTVDWEARRAKAKGLLREQTGKSWVGFSRLGGSSTSNNATNAGRVENSDAQELADDAVQGKVCSRGNAEAGTSIEPLFDTTQTAGAVDDLGKPPSREAPVAPVSGLAATTNRESQKSDGGRARSGACTTALELVGDLDTPCSAKGRVSPTPSHYDSGSKTDSELQQNLEMALQYQRLSECPGAFPLSRNGSTKSKID
ncbi:hypothetical protein EK21DRAFT_118201 [Setomelanomma holmii]|uniref:Uncharacterized protein n=1 Tax=Setomelanomma holmii TaxID=210430 RepID=A0A9P4LG61_9PLEO|nr:hypothetical protein EK21DRAFT_118201 [Setomelanomma holmii]